MFTSEDMLRKTEYKESFDAVMEMHGLAAVTGSQLISGTTPFSEMLRSLLVCISGIPEIAPIYVTEETTMSKEA